MKRSLKAILLASSLLLSVSAAQAQTTYQVSPGVSDGVLNLREGPSPEYGLVAAMPASALVQVYKCVPPQVSYSKANWCQTIYKGKHGWASTSGMAPFEMDNDNEGSPFPPNAELMPGRATPPQPANTFVVGPSDFQGGNFICNIVRLQEGEPDSDPVSSIEVTLGFKANNRDLDSMGIVHNTVRGVHWNRSNQYVQMALTQTPDKLEVAWLGVYKRDSSVTMLGRIWNQAGTGHWFYSESQFQHGRLQMKMDSSCKPNSLD